MTSLQLTNTVTVQSAENRGKSVTDSGYVTSYSYSNFERPNISFKENKPDCVDPNFNGFCYYIRKKEGRTLRFAADCVELCIASGQ